MRVLVVEDDPDLSAQLAASLGREGYAVDHADDGEDAEFLGATETYDAVVLDLGLPRLDGLSVLRRWRGAGNLMPVLILTSRDAWHEKVQGIDAGADDYLAKPFRFEELLARMRALVRRGGAERLETLRYGPLSMDRLRHEVRMDDQPMDLTPMEFQLLEFFLLHPEEVVRRTTLLEKVWDMHFDPESNVVDVHVGNLRRKLAASSGGNLISTVRGVGFCLRANHTAATRSA